MGHYWGPKTRSNYACASLAGPTRDEGHFLGWAQIGPVTKPIYRKQRATQVRVIMTPDEIFYRELQNKNLLSQLN